LLAVFFVLNAQPLHRLPVAGLLKVAGLARSTFYYQQKALQKVDKHAPIKSQIEAVCARHRGRYGYRRVTAAIRQMGQVINHKTVQRLMGQLQLKSLVRPKKYRSYKGEVGRIAIQDSAQSGLAA
jgi:putative transposase